MAGETAKRTLGPLKMYALGGGAAIVLAAFAIHGHYPAPLVFVLFAGGIGAIGYGALVYLKSQRSSIIVQSRPLLGQTLRGRILSGIHVMPGEVRVTMRCVHEWTEFGGSQSITDLLTSSRRNRYSQRRHETVWEESAVVDRKSLGGVPSGFTVPFEFALPQDGHRSGYESDELYRWEIEARASIPGIDFHAIFAVKVSR